MKKIPALIWEISSHGKKGFDLPNLDVPKQAGDLIAQNLLRTEKASLPEVTEVDVVRHFTNLSNLNYGVDTGFYPLGSCTMKYNPKIDEDMANLDQFKNLHPMQQEGEVQGALRILFEMQNYLAEITGMDEVTLQPVAGAHGELTGLKIISAYFQHRQEKRTQILIPDSAHGTNPASAAMNAFEVIQVPSDETGCLNPAILKKYVSASTAAIMLTNPNTVGLFERHIQEVAEIVHGAGALLYYDGANANAIMGITRPGDMGFDVVHINLHKTFATPHGGGGPGAGPVGVKAFLAPFLPIPQIKYEKEKYCFDEERPLSIGKMHSFYGNFAVILKAYTYIRRMGPQHLKQASLDAVLNANYLKEKLKNHYLLPYTRPCLHEVVFSGKNFNIHGVHTLDIAKRLLDYGYHPPTIYFPLIVEEAMMIEPTENESKVTLDEFILVMQKIAQEAQENPQVLKEAPHCTPVLRLDETNAARKPHLRWKNGE